ncbi:hypothetical protein L2725_03345 [Shewanella corallii]|uniref:DUF2946 domain-containing protein n=1 Tax=Shewanella corallii TaxID=560080 RepID=A0ABT0N306_9GAMM|nr:hypothetical protein [Shewanella corallii]MCL2912828.1 hypothetical protein [Shewanella corallii]
MFSQSLRAQLCRMTLLLTATLLVVHHTPGLIELLASHATQAGCHQGGQHSTGEQNTRQGDSAHHHH